MNPVADFGCLVVGEEEVREEILAVFERVVRGGVGGMDNVVGNSWEETGGVLDEVIFPLDG